MHSLGLFSGLKYPALHSQSAAEADPGTLSVLAAQAWHAALQGGEKVFAGHVAHVSIAPCFAKAPAAHGAHGALPAGLALPGAHATQENGASSAPKPAAHEQFESVAAPAAALLFRGQSLQTAAPASAYVSSAHCSHCASPGIAL